jgi:hypothetical protein
MDWSVAWRLRTQVLNRRLWFDSRWPIADGKHSSIDDAPAGIGDRSRRARRIRWRDPLLDGLGRKNVVADRAGVAGEPWLAATPTHWCRRRSRPTGFVAIDRGG